MRRLILHHTYNDGIAFDVSGSRSHGVPYSTLEGRGETAGSLGFEGGESRVEVAGGGPWDNPLTIRVRARFRHEPRRPGERRHNLIEGHLSFALFIEPDGSLVGTIRDSLGRWRGARSRPDVVKPGTWQTVDFAHDGGFAAALALDGTVVARATDVPGPVRSVGPRGVVIGHWPEPDPRYTLEGWIDTIKVWRFRPRLEETIDPCCADPERIDRLLDSALREGWTIERLGSVVQEVGELNAEIWRATLGEDRRRHAQATVLVEELRTALETRSVRRLARAIVGIRRLLEANVGAAERRDFEARARRSLRGLPYGDLLLAALRGDPRAARSVVGLAQAFCIEGVPAPPAPPAEGLRVEQREIVKKEGPQPPEWWDDVEIVDEYPEDEHGCS